MMKTSGAGLEIIKRNEGCRLDAYQDSVGVWTIGYGDTGPDVQEGLTITQEEAERRLADRLAHEFEPAVRAAIGGIPTTQNQFDAMTSLAYNIGASAFRGSTVARMHGAGRYNEAAKAFHLWTKAGGEYLPGLARRRKEEAELYRKPNDTADAATLDEDIENAVRLLQTLLTDRGIDPGPVDGDPGPRTVGALHRWREMR